MTWVVPGWPNQARRLIEGQVSIPNALRVRNAYTELPSPVPYTLSDSNGHSRTNKENCSQKRFK